MSRQARDLGNFMHATVTRPSEVLFQNVQAMENRLNMMDLFRMKKQINIDMEKLRTMQRPWSPPSSSPFCFEKQIRIISGLRQPIMTCTDRRASVTFSPMGIGLSDAAQHKLKHLSMQRYNPATNTVKISCDRFPFYEQNEQYIRDTLSKLIEEASRNPEEFAHLSNIHRESRVSINHRINLRMRGPPPGDWKQEIGHHDPPSSSPIATGGAHAPQDMETQ